MTTPEQKVQFVKENCEPELAFIFATEELPVEVQYDFVHKGFKTVHKFANIDDTKEAVKKACKDEWGITDRLHIAAIVSTI